MTPADIEPREKGQSSLPCLVTVCGGAAVVVSSVTCMTNARNARRLRAVGSFRLAVYCRTALHTAFAWNQSCAMIDHMI